MNKASSRCLVIDADIVCAASDSNCPDPTPRCCRAFLSSVFNICHRVALTPEIREEWDRHKSRVGVQWRASMSDHEKIVLLESLEVNQALRDAIQDLRINQEERDVMLKDCHLLEAALATDRIVVSRDGTARGLFARHAESLPGIADVVWVDPVKSAEEVASWLKNGALSEERYKLRNYQPHK